MPSLQLSDERQRTQAHFPSFPFRNGRDENPCWAPVVRFRAQAIGGGTRKTNTAGNPAADVAAKSVEIAAAAQKRYRTCETILYK
jgi:hypothetical protein